MSLSHFLKDHLSSIILNIVAMIMSTLFLRAIGVSMGEIFIVVTVWGIIALLYYGITIHYRSKRMRKLLNLAENLEKKYLLPEIMKKPNQSMETVYYQILKMAGKSMMEEVGVANRESYEYKEYIEHWVHDVKTPISGIQLLCANNKSAWTKTLLVELEKVEQALYYARSEEAEKDYIVREILVADMVHAAILENKKMLLRNGVQIQFKENDISVYADKKWIGFILNQLIINAVQYHVDAKQTLSFFVQEMEHGISLTVQDNGIGIGLYLCKRLCDKLGLSITAQSEVGAYTAISLFFPKGTFAKVE